MQGVSVTGYVCEGAAAASQQDDDLLRASYI